MDIGIPGMLVKTEKNVLKNASLFKVHEFNKSIKFTKIIKIGAFSSEVRIFKYFFFTACG